MGFLKTYHKHTHNNLCGHSFWVILLLTGTHTAVAQHVRAGTVDTSAPEIHGGLGAGGVGMHWLAQGCLYPNCRVSYWASINCLLRSLLPWFSAMFQSVFDHSALFIPQKKPVPSASTNCCTPQTDWIMYMLNFLHLQDRGLGWWFKPGWMSSGRERLYKLTPLARAWFWNGGFDERKRSLS